MEVIASLSKKRPALLVQDTFRSGLRGAARLGAQASAPVAVDVVVTLTTDA